MSTVTSDFLAQLDREIADNTLPPLPGTAPTLEPQPDECPTTVMKNSLIAYLSALYEAVSTIEAIPQRHPELHDRTHAILGRLVSGAGNLVASGDELESLLIHVCELQGIDHNQQGATQC